MREGEGNGDRKYIRHNAARHSSHSCQLFDFVLEFLSFLFLLGFLLPVAKQDPFSHRPVSHRKFILGWIFKTFAHYFLPRFILLEIGRKVESFHKTFIQWVWLIWVRILISGTTKSVSHLQVQNVGVARTVFSQIFVYPAYTVERDYKFSELVVSLDVGHFQCKTVLFFLSFH